MATNGEALTCTMFTHFSCAAKYSPMHDTLFEHRQKAAISDIHEGAQLHLALPAATQAPLVHSALFLAMVATLHLGAISATATTPICAFLRQHCVELFLALVG
jgi:hypothetical protein